MSTGYTIRDRRGGSDRPKLFDPAGRVIDYGLYPSPRLSGYKHYRPRLFLSQDTRANVNPYDRYEMVTYSRQLFAQMANLGRATVEKNSWAFGDAWEPHFTGKNVKWGEEASDWLKNQFYPGCNVRGMPFDLIATMLTTGIAYDRDGDDLLLLTEAENHFPQIMILPATRVGSKENGGVITSGQFSGCKNYDGVIQDRRQRTVGVSIFGFEEDPETQISSYSADLGYEPEWGDQTRGIPLYARGLLDGWDMQDIDVFLKRGLKLAASVGLITWNEEGESSQGPEAITTEVDDPTQSTNPVTVEQIEGGEGYYFRANSGSKIETLKDARPTVEQEKFFARVERRMIYSLGWSYHLLYPEIIGGAPSRIMVDLANKNLRIRRKNGLRRWKRIICYAIAKAMKEGFLSKNHDGADPYQWHASMPGDITADGGNDEKASLDNLKMGKTTMAIETGKKGHFWKSIRDQRQKEIEDLAERAKAVSSKYPEIPFDKAMELLEQRAPNPTAQATNDAPPKPEEKP